MKHTRFVRALSAALALTLLAGCAAQASPVPAPDVSLPPLPQAEVTQDVLYGDFSAELLRRCRSQGKNTLVSPLSVLLALGMTANGAKGDTLAAFEDTFGMTLPQLNALCADYLAEYGGLGGSTESSLANGIWVADHVALEDPFAARCLKTYDAGLFAADFADPAAVRQVNSWVEDQTHGLIPRIVEEFDPATAVALVNAIYLKNQWLYPFKTPTHEWTFPFTAADGRITDVPGMSNGIRDEQYLRTDSAQGVLLPYDDGRLGFFALLPDNKKASLDGLLPTLSGQSLAEVLNSAEPRKVNLCMPKFEVEWDASLKDVLAAMGLAAAFDPSTADFTAMGTSPIGPLYISDVLHKTALKVNEKGTEAAAVTAVIAPAGAERPTDQIDLTLDRPFLYGIVDLERGTPLFLGTFEQP